MRGVVGEVWEQGVVGEVCKVCGVRCGGRGVVGEEWGVQGLRV